MRGQDRGQGQHATRSSQRTILSAGWARISGVVIRAWGHAGPDRDTLLLIIKSVVAASAAWLIAHNLLGASSATFAPFTALLMVQATVSKSLFQGLRYAAAMVFGVVLAGLLTPLLGALLVTFSMLVLVALLFGQWRRFGSQGPQVGVAAMFAYSAFLESGAGTASFAMLGSIAGLVVLGCTLGVATNLLIVPPLRYRSARYGISSVSQSLCDLLCDMAEGTRQAVPDSADAEEWRHRANQFPETIEQARATVEQAAESMRFNPRRLFLRRSTSFAGHRSVLNALERASEQLRSIARGLAGAVAEDAPHQHEHDRFFATYSELLSTVAEAARVLGTLHNSADTEQARALAEATDRSRQAYQELVDQITGQELDRPDQWPIYGGLQTDAHRIVEEFLQAHNNLTPLMEPSSHSAQTGRAE